AAPADTRATARSRVSPDSAPPADPLPTPRSHGIEKPWGRTRNSTGSLCHRPRPTFARSFAMRGSGMCVQDMAATLDITPDEVRTRVQSILTKLQVHSRQEAIQAWRRLRP